MKRLLIAGLMLASSLMATDRHMWLLDMSNVPGVEATNLAGGPWYGVQVFVGTDDPSVTGWWVEVTVATLDGAEEATYRAWVDRTVTYEGVPFSDAVVFWVAPDLNWKVVSIFVDSF